MEAQQEHVALPLRSYTILGVCQGIGEDFGFNPNFLRVPLAATVLWSPMWAAVAYLALGAVVLASRLLFPQKKDVAELPKEEVAAANQQVEFAKAA